MASGEEYVRLSHKDLLNMAKLIPENKPETVEKNTGKKVDEKAKKPERQIYKPGQTRLSKKQDELDVKSGLVIDSRVSTEILAASAVDSRPTSSLDSKRICDEANFLHERNKSQDQSEMFDRPQLSSHKDKSHQKKLAFIDNSSHVSKEFQADNKYHSRTGGQVQEEELFVINAFSPTSSSVTTISNSANMISSVGSERSSERSSVKTEFKFSEKREKRAKKPDIQLYVPKGRQQICLDKDKGSASQLASDTPDDSSGGSETNVSKVDTVALRTQPKAKETVAGIGERKVTMKNESVFEVTVSCSQSENNSEEPNESIAMPTKKQQQRNKNRGECHDARARRKVVHDGRSPRNRYHHCKLGTNAHSEYEGVRANETSDVSEPDELEWDHQADLDLGKSQMNLHHGSEDLNNEMEDECNSSNTKLQSSISPLVKKPGRRRNRRNAQQRRDQTTWQQSTESESAVDKPPTGSDEYSDICSNSTVPAAEEDKFTYKFDGLVIMNSKKGNVLPLEAVQDRQHQLNSTKPNETDDSKVERTKQTDTSKDRKERIQKLKKTQGSGNSAGGKFNSSEGPKTDVADKTETASASFIHQSVKNPAKQNNDRNVKGKEKLNIKVDVPQASNGERLTPDINLSANVGGIIRLPAGTTTSVDPKGNHLRSDQLSNTGRAAPLQQNAVRRGHVPAHRTLWDPSKPAKVANSSPVGSHKAPSYFCDPEFSEQVPYFMYGSDVSSRNYEYLQQQQQQQSIHPYYRSGPPCLPVESYDYRFPAPGFDSPTYSHDLYFQTCNDQAIGNQSTLPAQLIICIREAAMFDNQMVNLISHGINSEEAMRKLNNLRNEVLSRYEQVILMDLDFSNHQNIGEALWRSAFYQVIEILRKQAKERDSDTKKYLLTILDDGVEYFEKLLQKLQTKYSFALEKYLDFEQLVPECASRTIKLCLISCQRILMCLGDLARYKELANQTSNYGKARSCYMKAQHLAPKNGKPYNQLAVLAIYTRRKIDAVYYYMRSLAATNPLLTARESLISLFEEARRKMEQTERTRNLEKAQKKRARSKWHGSQEQSHRVEIWISSDGSSSHDQVRDNEDDSDDLSGLSVVELNKRFILSFLHVHGKLFTKIGMETFPEAVGRMLQEFRILIQHSPSVIGYMRLIQLMTINMFAIESTIHKEALDDSSCRSVMQEQAVQLGLEMFGLLIEQCIHLFCEHLKSCHSSGAEKAVVMGEDLQQLLPGIKAWSDWMICHSNLWNPPPVSFDPLLGPNVDVWKLVSDFFNILSEFDLKDVVMLTQKTEGYKPIMLPEDVALAGFIPLLSITNAPVYVPSDVDKDLVQDCYRIDKLKTFAEVLYGLDPAILSYNVETHCYSSLVTSGPTEESDTAQAVTSNKVILVEDLPNDLKNDDIIIESESTEWSADVSDEEHHISQLKARKQELCRKVAEEAKKQEHIQAAIDNSHQDFRRIELEIRPVFLVLDTNCLIDHLKSIRKLLDTRKYNLTIPLVVINELDGLAKNLKESCYDTIEHAEMVRSSAEAAVEFLETQFEKRNPYLRAITSKGSTLDTIAFRSEEPQDAGTNDDLILSCCLRHCQDKARDFMPKLPGEPIKLYRDVVLVTNDRNLRLKAHLHNVPVKDIPGFLKWANIS